MLEGWLVYPFAVLVATIIGVRDARRGLPGFVVAMRVLFVLYLGWVVGATLFPLPLGAVAVHLDAAGRGVSVELAPLASVREVVRDGSRFAQLWIIGGNVLTLAPFGFLLPFAAPRLATWPRMAAAAVSLPAGDRAEPALHLARARLLLPGHRAGRRTAQLRRGAARLRGIRRVARPQYDDGRGRGSARDSVATPAREETMKRALLPLAIGCGLVAIIAVVLLLRGWDWTWFAVANGALTVLLLVLFRGSVSGEDERRPPGAARVSAARWAGPMDPDTLAAQEHALHPDPEIDAAGAGGGSRDRVLVPVDRRAPGRRDGRRDHLLPLALQAAVRDARRPRAAESRRIGVPDEGDARVQRRRALAVVDVGALVAVPLDRGGSSSALSAGRSETLARRAPLADVAETLVPLGQSPGRGHRGSVLPGRDRSAATRAGLEFEGAAPDRARRGGVHHRDAVGRALLHAGAAAHTVNGFRLAEGWPHVLVLAATDRRQCVVAQGRADAHAELAEDAAWERRVGEGSEPWLRHVRAATRAAGGPAHRGRAAAAAPGSWPGACGCSVSPSPRRGRPTQGSRTRSSTAPSRDPAGAPPSGRGGRKRWPARPRGGRAPGCHMPARRAASSTLAPASVMTRTSSMVSSTSTAAS